MVHSAGVDASKKLATQYYSASRPGGITYRSESEWNFMRDSILTREYKIVCIPTSVKSIHEYFGGQLGLASSTSVSNAPCCVTGDAWRPVMKLNIAVCTIGFQIWSI